jgi:hypothetical protein
MASGHVNGANRPNTWLHRPTLRRDDCSCQPGAVHTWPLTDSARDRNDVRSWPNSGRLETGLGGGCLKAADLHQRLAKVT